MEIKLYNTLSRKKEKFTPIKRGEVGIYSCGPTVYWYQHIGNLKAYIFSDMLKRALLFNGYKIKHVINVTDVGHLTSDADSGEDKMEKASKKEGKSAKEIADHYFSIFKEDIEKLNIIAPNVWSRATDHIREQIDLVKSLEKKGYTYKTSDGIYFDSAKFKGYEKLAKLDIKGLQAGKRVGLGEKKNKTDFALWKFSNKPGERQQEWESPWGVGFPGWHIECSAMSMKYLGKTFDIHTGGIDHIPIHHTNEIAQSEAATGQKFVHYWMHQNFLNFKGQKVSKSSGGLFTLRELEEKGFSPLEYRYLILSTHYRKPLNFSIEILKKSQEAYNRIKNIIEEQKDDGKENEEYLEEFKKAINDDLNYPRALQIVWKLVRDEKASGKFRTLKKMDEVLGLSLFEFEEIKIPKKILEMVEKREKARKEKNWNLADEIRNKIKKEGYFLNDTADGTKVEKIKEVL